MEKWFWEGEKSVSLYAMYICVLCYVMLDIFTLAYHYVLVCVECVYACERFVNICICTAILFHEQSV